MKKMDITSQVLNNVLDFFPGNVYWQNDDGIVLGCNENQAKVFNMSVKESIGKTMYDFFPPQEASRLLKTIRKVIKTGKAVSLKEKLTVSGKTYHYYSKKNPIKDDKGQVIGIIGMSIDITSEQDMLEKLNLAIQVKQEFLKNMAHDWRTPLSNIYGLATILSNRELQFENKTLCNNIAECANELLNSFDILQNFSTLDKNVIIEKPFSLKSLVIGLEKIVKPSCSNKQIDFICHYDETTIPPILLGDPYRIKIILTNLTNNAIQFTHNGKITLTVTAHKITEKDLHKSCIIKICISDTGIGIPQKDQDRIFEVFSKLHSSWKGIYKGMGIGLKLVKDFVQDLHGEIHLKSKEGKGSTFTIFLPLKISLSNSLPLYHSTSRFEMIWPEETVDD